MSKTDDFKPSVIDLRAIAWKLAALAQLLKRYDSDDALPGKEILGLGILLEDLVKEFEVALGEDRLDVR
ncbi:MAG: hypothetical protein JST16_06465 [Bdellovibrionales bacterium]|nr:hypothetical protein [Bdellovibrionales bacterium]